MADDSLFEISIGDRTYSMESDDEYLRDMRGVFEPQTVELFRALVAPDAIALDVGANVGCTALLLSQLAAETVAFEPSPSTFRRLERNVATASNVSVVNAGLGREDAELSIVFAPSNRSGGFISADRPEGHVVESVRIKQGDDHVATSLSGRRVDFIKIDVEGFELEVLAGLSQTIKRDQPIVTLELNHWCLNAFQRTSVPDFLDELLDTFPILFAVQGGEAVALHEPANRFRVMYSHILHFEYSTLVGAFSEEQLAVFVDAYVTHGSPAQSPPSPYERIDQLEKLLRKRDRRLKKMSDQVDAMKASTSWRVTRPLRAVKARMK